MIEHLRGLMGKRPEDTVQLVPDRFIQVFKDHGVEASQIPRLFPEITLSHLQSFESLYPKLTPELLDRVAAFFGVRSEWLEGVDDVIYNYQDSYKQPYLFFEALTQIEVNFDHYPVRLIAVDNKLDYKNKGWQTLGLIVRIQIALLGEKRIYKYYIFDNVWSWQHWSCRIQLKAIARLIFMKWHKPIPIFKVEPKILDAICHCQLIPDKFVSGGACTDPSLEDYGLSKEQSCVAKETDELPEVLEYIEDYKLEEHVAKVGNYSSANDAALYKNQEISAKELISSQASRNALSRYKELHQIKQSFIRFYFSKSQPTIKSAAMEYMMNLSYRDRLLLVPTYDEKEFESSRDKAIRTLQTCLREYKQDNKPDWLTGFEI